MNKVPRYVLMNWLSESRFDTALTLTFEIETSEEEVRRCWDHFCIMMDRKILGPRHRRKPPHLRFDAIAFTENPHANTHLHLVASSKQSAVGVSPDDLATFAKDIWRKLVPVGSVKGDEVRSGAWANYITKDYLKADRDILISRTARN